jgi:phenylalanyl-tRNA synthetase beta chain
MLFSRQWLGEYVELPPGSEQVAERLTFAGFNVDSVRRAAPAGDGGADSEAADCVLDVEVTTNRPDCMNPLGLARELAVLFERPLAPPVRPESAARGPVSAAAAAAGLGGSATVEVADAAACPRYVALLIDDVQVGPSPRWLVNRLETIGLRSINNVVDVTNFVLWELGQPLHAYDLDRLAGARIEVRRGRPGENLLTLDGVLREVDPEVLVIADAERPVGLAGVMGGRHTEVTASTRRVLLESACFERRLVRRTGKRLGMHTDASHRFERGIDLEGCRSAAERAAALIAELAGGSVRPGAVDRRVPPPPPRRGRLELRRLNAFAGAEVAEGDAARWLAGLGFELAPLGPAAWEVTIPSWRWFDFEPGPGGVYEADLFEEVLRIYGFDRIPAALPAIPGSDGPPTERQRVRERVRQALSGVGFAEAIHFGFEDPRMAATLPILRPGAEPLLVANPLSERYSAMRRSLLGNLLDSARFNQRRGAAAVRLFEVASVFFPGRSVAPDLNPLAPVSLAPFVHLRDPSAASPPTFPDEEEHVVLVCGGRVGLPWDREAVLDLFDLGGAVEALARALGVRFETRPAELPGMVAGSAAELLDGSGAVVGVMGRIEGGEGYPLYAAEAVLAAFEGAAGPRPLAMPPRVPGINADLTLTHALSVRWRDLAAAIDALRPPDLVDFALKARYQGEGVPEEAVNTTITFHYNAVDRSLTQDEVNERQLGLAAELTRRFGWRA